MEADINKLPDSLPEFLEMLKNNSKINSSDYGNLVNRYLDTKAREKLMPMNGKFELTPVCNLDCKMCYVHLNKDQIKSSQLLSTEDWKSLFKQAIDSGMMQAEISGGECLTYPGFDELYLYLQSYGVETIVFTNGLLLDDKRIEFFKANPSKFIQVTLYGSCEDAYERVTGHRAFNRVYTNILKAKDAGLPVKLAITPNAFMGDDGKKVVKAAFDTGLQMRINYNLIDPYEDTGRHGMELDASLDQYVEMNRYYSELRNINVIPVDETSLPDLGSESDGKEYGVRCGAGRSAFSINWKGEMYPCLSLYKIKPAFPLRDGFKKAWEQTTGFSSEYMRPVECVNCEYKNVCLSCAALHYQKDNPGHANKQICERTKRMVKEGILKLV